jgi:hypothetical protein
MDWIEQWFGFLPDGGDGSIEALIIGLIVTVLLLVVVLMTEGGRAVFRSVAARFVGTRGKTS